MVWWRRCFPLRRCDLNLNMMRHYLDDEQQRQTTYQMTELVLTVLCFPGENLSVPAQAQIIGQMKSSRKKTERIKNRELIERDKRAGRIKMIRLLKDKHGWICVCVCVCVRAGVCARTLKNLGVRCSRICHHLKNDSWSGVKLMY